MRRFPRIESYKTKYFLKFILCATRYIWHVFDSHSNSKLYVSSDLMSESNFSKAGSPPLQSNDGDFYHDRGVGLTPLTPAVHVEVLSDIARTHAPVEIGGFEGLPPPTEVGIIDGERIRRSPLACENCRRRKVRCNHPLDGRDTHGCLPASSCPRAGGSKRKSIVVDVQSNRDLDYSVSFLQDLVNFLSSGDPGYVDIVVKGLREKRIGLSQLRVIVSPEICLSAEEHVRGIS